MISPHLKAVTEQITQDVLSMEDVRGVMLFSTTGELLFNAFTSPPEENLTKKSWTPFIDVLSDVQEAELVFDRLKLYIRKAQIGFLMVVMESSGSVSMMRLHCDVLIPSLTNQPNGKPKGISRFFKKQK
jgi:hypothetical protein